MRATLNLNLSDALNAEELRELTETANQEHKTIERLLFEAAKDLVRRIREKQFKASVPATAA